MDITMEGNSMEFSEMMNEKDLDALNGAKEINLMECGDKEDELDPEN